MFKASAAALAKMEFLRKLQKEKHMLGKQFQVYIFLLFVRKSSLHTLKYKIDCKNKQKMSFFW